MKTFFLADDLSGALDAAAAFHHTGRKVRIMLSTAEWTTCRDEEVVGVTTESRNASATTAAAAVEAALERGRALGAQLLYKKIDSTLRGQVAAEIAVLTRLLPATRILFAPANPAVGRTVKAGVLHVHGVPVSETEFSRDPVCPVRESHIPRLLGRAAGPNLFVADAATDEDLAAAVAKTAVDHADWVAVGSGALARPVARQRLGQKARPTKPVPLRMAPGPILLVSGSAHPLNRVQATALARQHGVPAFEMSHTDPEPAASEATARLLTTGAASLLIESERGESAQVLRRITTAVQEVIANTGATRLFITGGETAFALCRALGISALEFRAELEPGLGLASATGPTGPWLLAIKPGGFGAETTWIRAWDRLRRER